MLVSHLSDLHLGYAQFNLEEREEDVYEVFQEAVDISIAEGVKLVLLAGDIFHTPRPYGKAIITLGNALKKLKDKEITAAFILGEHDISRVRDVPLAYVFSNLGVAKRLHMDQPLELGDDAVIFGADKERRSSIDQLVERLKGAGKMAKEYPGRAKKILVLHQGITDINRFAGELNSADLPPEFDYYAMGHYHDHEKRRFDFLGGPLMYPGSIDLTPSEGIKDVKKGFVIADLSGEEVSTNFVPLLRRRKQFATRISYADIASEVEDIIRQSQSLTENGKKPIAKIDIAGSALDSSVIANNLRRLNDYCLHYLWRPLEEGGAMPADGLVLDGRPEDIDGELYRLSREALGSDELAALAVSELLPRAAEGDAAESLRIVWDAFQKKRSAPQ